MQRIWLHRLTMLLISITVWRESNVYQYQFIQRQQQQTYENDDDGNTEKKINKCFLYVINKKYAESVRYLQSFTLMNIHIHTHYMCVSLIIHISLSLSLSFARVSDLSLLLHSRFPHIFTFLYSYYYSIQFYFIKITLFFPISIDVCLCISISFPNGIVLDQRYECGWIEHFSSFVVLRLLELCCNNTQLRLKWIPMEWKRPNKRNNTRKNKISNNIPSLVLFS